MKAITFSRYGSPDVLQIQEVEKPTPQDDEVLVKIHASSVNPVQWYAMTGLFLVRLAGSGLLKPKDPTLGSDFAGVIEAVGKDVTDIKEGDEVFGETSWAFAEYACVRNTVTSKPANLTFQQAAAIPSAAITALQGLRDYGKIQSGQKILINGASGGVGTFAVQIAKAFRAEVTAVCSTKNVEIARSLGADYVIDYTREDFTRNRRRYDLLFDIAGNRRWSECKRILNPEAIFVIVGGPKTNRWMGPLGHVIKVRLASLGASQKTIFFITKFNREDLVVLREFVESGKVRPIIESSYPLSKITDAMRHLGTGHAQGKIVVTMGDTAKDENDQRTQ